MSSDCKGSSGTYRSQHLPESIPATLPKPGRFTEGRETQNWLKLTENRLKTESSTVQILRKINRPTSREDSGGPLSIPLACPGRHKIELKICSHQMKFPLGNEAGAGKTEKIIPTLVITLGIGWWRQISKVAWSHPGLHDARNGTKREHHKASWENSSILLFQMTFSTSPGMGRRLSS